MDRFTKAMGQGDVMALKEGLSGLVFDNWSDEEIAAGVAEMVADCRVELAEVFATVKNHKHSGEESDG